MIIQPNFPDHWKTDLLVKLAGSESAIRCLLRFWAHCQNQKQWKFTGLNPERLASICKWEGDPDVFFHAITNTFISVSERFAAAHQWEQFNASLISNWNNGKKGGRKKKTQREPNETHGLPTANPTGTDRLDRLDRENIPPNPQGGNGQRGKGIVPTTPEAKTIASLFKRKESTPWQEKEVKAFKKIMPMDAEELALVCAYTEAERKKGDEGIHRRDLVTFLNNFRTEVDRAREWARRNPKTARQKVAPVVLPDPEPEGFRAWLLETYPKVDQSKKWSEIPQDIRDRFTKSAKTTEAAA